MPETIDRCRLECWGPLPASFVTFCVRRRSRIVGCGISSWRSSWRPWVLTCCLRSRRFLLERHSRQTEITTFGSAVFWTTTQLLTVSSQIKNPISVGGRVLDVFMEIYAITVIA